MKIRIFALIVFLSVFAAGLSAQSTAREVETLLSTNAVTYSQAARFVLEAAQVMTTRNPAEAFDFAAGKGWLPKDTVYGEAARLDGIALLLMNSFDLKGGIMFSLTKNSHFAYRELTYKNVIQGRVDPAMNVTGERLLFYTGRLLAMTETLARLELEN